jgi:GMP synthase (glutamine-hydrolysing)
MKRALIIQHLACEGPGRLAPLLFALNYAVDRCYAFAGEGIPTSLTHDLFIFMGGPMGVSDIGDERYPFLARECSLLKSILQHNHPALGICLGAQLLAHAAGARVYPNVYSGHPRLEVGWAPVRFLDAESRLELQGISDTEMMLHWHGDTFDLPVGATLLASTDYCTNQLFRLRRQVGIQFHPEIEATMVEEWVKLDAAYVAKAHGHLGATQILHDTAHYVEQHQHIGDQLLRNLIQAITH